MSYIILYTWSYRIASEEHTFLIHSFLVSEQNILLLNVQDTKTDAISSQSLAKYKNRRKGHILYQSDFIFQINF